MVPAVAAAQRPVSLVGARQRQLQRDRRRSPRWTMPRSSRRRCCSNFYLKGLHSLAQGARGGALSHSSFRTDQGDPTRVAQMVARLMAQGIEVQRANAELTLKEGTFPAGTYVVRLDQPYRNYAVDLLTPQSSIPRMPAEPYDDVSWALPAHYHLTGDRDRRPGRARRGAHAARPRRRSPQGAVAGARSGVRAARHRAGGIARGALSRWRASR